MKIYFLYTRLVINSSKNSYFHRRPLLKKRQRFRHGLLLLQASYNEKKVRKQTRINNVGWILTLSYFFLPGLRGHLRSIEENTKYNNFCFKNIKVLRIIRCIYGGGRICYASIMQRIIFIFKSCDPLLTLVEYE